LGATPGVHGPSRGLPLARRDAELVAPLLLWDLFNLALAGQGRRTVSAKQVRHQELDADLLAARLIGDVGVAVRTLRMLVDGDMASPSHHWEVLGFVAPVMTMGERVAELHDRWNSNRPK
jgi:Zn-dependent protease with chaperone function